jgi:hypothetical protein
MWTVANAYRRPIALDSLPICCALTLVTTGVPHDYSICSDGGAFLVSITGEEHAAEGAARHSKVHQVSK